MIQLESKTGIVKGSQEKVFTYLSDFRNFSSLMPKERLSDLEISQDKIRFGLQGLGTVGLMIRDKMPFSGLTITATEDSSADFTFHVHIHEAGSNQSEVTLKLQANLNLFLEMMAKAPLQQFVDMIVDKLSDVEFK
jgi:carbon monoxide dehydrogenase subunit G